MNNFTKDASVAKRAAVELRALATYLDDHDAGRLPVNACGYQAASHKVKLLLATHLKNYEVRQLCVKSQALHEIFGNLLTELEPEMAPDLVRALAEAGLSAYWLQ